MTLAASSQSQAQTGLLPAKHWNLQNQDKSIILGKYVEVKQVIQTKSNTAAAEKNEVCVR